MSGIKVTFKPLSSGRYRAIINGVLVQGPQGVTKNPKKKRHIIIRTHDAPRIHELRKAEKAAKASLPWWLR